MFKANLSVKKRYMEIIALVKEAIISGRLKPGNRLPTELEMVEQLGISRTSVREAMKILEAMGIIDVKRREGMFLRESFAAEHINPLFFGLIIHGNNTRKLIEFRVHFEGMVIEMASELCTAADSERLEGIFREQLNSMDSDLEYWADLDMRFHQAILEITDNPFVLEIGKTIYDLYKSKMKEISRRAGRQQTIQTHQLYITALKTGTREDLLVLKQQIRKNYENLYDGVGL